MKRTLELELIEEALSMRDAGKPYLDKEMAASPVDRYSREERFRGEVDHLFRKTPNMLAHASELPGPGSFLRRDFAGLPILLTRDRKGAIHAFLNVCRHRGSRLVATDSGCARTLVCPYHAWTWGLDGSLKGMPHGDVGFPGLDKNKFGLRRLPAEERLGWIWVLPDPQATVFDLDEFLGPLAEDLAWLDAGSLTTHDCYIRTGKANWKTFLEGGIESYHFPIAHQATIGPYFLDNLSSYRPLGRHLRSVLPRTSLDEIRSTPRENWRLRKHCNLVYTIMPTNQLLVQDDHIAWIQTLPISAGETVVRLSTLKPAENDMPDAHWTKNHRITVDTLSEDFEIGEGIQAGISSGANDAYTLARFEGAIDRFNATVEAYLPSENGHA